LHSNIRKILFIIPLILFYACKPKFPLNDDWSKKRFDLLNQDSTHVLFPQLLKGKIGVVSFIYTNCPDICPLTTHNMALIQNKLKNFGINKVLFISISFDSDGDTPSILKNYARVRNINLRNWMFLTGRKETIKKIAKSAKVFYAQSDSTILNNKTIKRYFVHTDRISLFDSNLHLRKNYYGSTINLNEIITDIKHLRKKMKKMTLLGIKESISACSKNKTVNQNIAIKATNAIVTPAAKGANAAVFMKITNYTSSNDTLFSVFSSASQLTQLHKSFKTSNGNMGMKRINNLVIPSNKSVYLKHGGVHIMLIGVKRDLNINDTLKVKLYLKNAHSLEIPAVVK